MGGRKCHGHFLVILAWFKQEWWQHDLLGAAPGGQLAGIPLANVLLGVNRTRLKGPSLERCQAWTAFSCQAIGRFICQQLPAIPQKGLGLVEPGQILRIRPIGALLMQLGIQAIQPLFQGHQALGKGMQGDSQVFCVAADAERHRRN